MDKRLKKSIMVRLQYEGTHFWEGCDIPEVEFLKYPHRHIFYIEAKKNVTDNDREIEIIMFKRQILKYLDETFEGDFKGMSCEDIAEKLFNYFSLDYCSVLEDNENGAVITNG